MIKFSKAKIKGEILAIPSKSYAHRIAILNFLAGNFEDVELGGFSSLDITATQNCLKSIRDKRQKLDCGESGSTLRFLLPLCSALGGNFEFVGHGKLMDRPNDELFKVLTENGIKVEKDKSIKISGKLTAGKYLIRGDISSQYVSGLLMALCILDGDSQIVLTTPLSSSPYVDITLELLSKYGAKIDKTDYGFKVYGNQKLCGNAIPEGDYSNSAFFMVLGAVAGKVKILGLNPNSVQGDKKIIDLIKLAGGKVKVKSDSIIIKKSRLKAFTYSFDTCPDLVPVACVLASACKGISKICDIKRLKIKESDRIESTLSMLKGFGINCFSDGKDITVYGGKAIGGKVDSFNDHRIAMASAVLGAIAKGESVLDGHLAVNKSYPTFYNDYNKLGGKAVEN